MVFASFRDAVESRASRDGQKSEPDLQLGGMAQKLIHQSG